MFYLWGKCVVSVFNYLWIVLNYIFIIIVILLITVKKKLERKIGWLKFLFGLRVFGNFKLIMLIL